MLRLIKINLRLRIFSPLFLLGCGAALTVGIVSGRQVAYVGTLHMTPTPLFAALITAVISVVFGIGDEFAFGTVRNKLICGVNKPIFYLSQLTASLIMGVIFFLLAEVPYFLMGYGSFFGKLFTAELLVRGGVLLGTAMLFCTAIAVFICFIVRNRAASLIVCTAAAAGLALSAVSLSRSLRYSEYEIIPVQELRFNPDLGEDDLVTVDEKTVLREEYVREPVRTVMYTALKLDPVSSIMSALDIIRADEFEIDVRSLEKIEAECEKLRTGIGRFEKDADYIRDSLVNSVYYPLWSGGAVILLTVIGVLIFKKRDIS